MGRIGFLGQAKSGSLLCSLCPFKSELFLHRIGRHPWMSRRLSGAWRFRMSDPLSRRVFLVLAGSAIAVPSFVWAASAEEEDDVPALLDHIILRCHDLHTGIEFAPQGTGSVPTVRGVHPPPPPPHALLSPPPLRYPAPLP